MSASSDRGRATKSIAQIESESRALGVPVLEDLLDEARRALLAGENSHELAVRLWPRFVQAVTIAAAEADSRRGLALFSWLNRPREEQNGAEG